MQTHEPYTAYAHWMLMHRMLTGAGVRHVQANMDQSSMSRAAFLCAFLDEVRRGEADAFFVRYTKFQTIDERESILWEAKRERERFREGLPREVREDRWGVARLMMKERIAAGQTYGKWNDVWIEHPEPTMNEPHKAMAWLTARESIGDDRKADMFLNAGLARIDNLFMKSRRLFSALERPVGTSSGHNTVWHGYAPYNPQMLETYLTIFRTVNNFVFVGDDGATPAMRLGFTREPLRYEDIPVAGAAGAPAEAGEAEGACSERVDAGWQVRHPSAREPRRQGVWAATPRGGERQYNQPRPAGARALERRL